MANVSTGLLVGLLAGVFVDRWDRRQLMLYANLVQAVALLPLLAVGSADQVWVVYAVVTVQASLAQFVAPAEHALLPRLVPASDLAAANSLNALNNNIARLLGPALGGVVAASTGLAGAAALDAMSFAVSAALVALITGTHSLAPSPEHRAESTSALRRLRGELADGLRVVDRSAVLRALFAVVVVTSLGEGIMSSLFAVFVDRALGGGAPQIGWLMSAQAVGGIAGGLLSTVLAGRIRATRMVAVGLVMFGVVDLVIFNYPRWFAALGPEIAFFVLVGLPGAMLIAGMMTLLQTEVDDARRGRVFATAMVAESAAALVGAALAASLTNALGVVNVLTVQGAAYVLAGLAFAALAPRSRSSAARPSEATDPVDQGRVSATR